MKLKKVVRIKISLVFVSFVLFCVISCSKKEKANESQIGGQLLNVYCVCPDEHETDGRYILEFEFRLHNSTNADVPIDSDFFKENFVVVGNKSRYNIIDVVFNDYSVLDNFDTSSNDSSIIFEIKEQPRTLKRNNDIIISLNYVCYPISILSEFGITANKGMVKENFDTRLIELLSNDLYCNFKINSKTNCSIYSPKGRIAPQLR